MSENCTNCQKIVYQMEKCSIDGKTFHKACFRCELCKCVLNLGNFATLEGKLYCKPHLQQLFAKNGNYDEGFGRVQHKKKWNLSTASAVASAN